MSNQKFEDFFNSVYGARWSALKNSLQKPERQILRVNLFHEPEYSEIIDLQPCEFLKNCYWRPESFLLNKDSNGLFNYYAMDPASVIVANAVEANPGCRVLDLCAAPGGKTLILAEALAGMKARTTGNEKIGEQNSIGDVDSSELISNEFSESRRDRLTRVITEYIPRSRRDRIFVKGQDGNAYGLRQPAAFDRVLADVPCSGERHLLENKTEFSLWTEKRSKNLSVRQFSLLSSAWLATKPGGRIVYSTCSISPLENDGVVAKLVKKRDVKILRNPEFQILGVTELTEHGFQILPDKTGFGPMYFSVIEKN